MPSRNWRALLQQALAARAERILKLTAAEGWLQDADAVHDVRVASRRLRTALDLAGPEQVTGWARHRKRAKALTRALGATRELDVHATRLAALAPELTDPACHGVLEHLVEDLDRRRRKARKRMARSVRRIDLAELGELLDGPQIPGPTAAPRIREALEPLLVPELQEPGQHVQIEEPAALHRLRIRVKKLRYAVEILAPDAAGWIRELKAFQEALGDYHDWFTLETALWRCHAELTERQRPVLAAGTLDLLGQLVDRRRAAFEALPAAAAALEATAILADLPGADSGASA